MLQIQYYFIVHLMFYILYLNTNNLMFSNTADYFSNAFSGNSVQAHVMLDQ